MKNYSDLGGCYPPQPSASADNTLLDLHNSSYHTQPHPIIANYSTIAPFYHIRAKERAKYATLLHCRTGQKYGLKEERQNGRTKLYFISGLINPLFDGLTYNTSGHFAHCSYFSSQNIRAYYMSNH